MRLYTTLQNRVSANKARLGKDRTPGGSGVVAEADNLPYQARGGTTPRETATVLFISR